MDLVFSFAPSGSFDLNGVVKSAYRFLDGSVVVLQEAGCVYDTSRSLGTGRDEFGTVKGYEGPFGALFRISVNPGFSAVFRVIPRTNTASDFQAVQAAAAKAEKPELAEIASRCKTVWEVVGTLAPEFPKLTLPPAPAAVLGMCAVLSATGLGPILLEDGALLDAKGALERLRELAKPAA